MLPSSIMLTNVFITSNLNKLAICIELPLVLLNQYHNVLHGIRLCILSTRTTKRAPYEKRIRYRVLCVNNRVDVSFH